MNVAQAISKIRDITDRTDLDTQILEAINSTIRNIEHKSNFTYMRDSDTPAFATGSYQMDFPTRFKRVRFLHATDGINRYKVVNQSEDVVLLLFPNLILDVGPAQTYTPQVEESKLLIRPTADRDYTMDFKFYAYSADVTADGTHWILENYPEVILFGACLELMPTLKDWDREPLWEKKYLNALKDLKKTEDANETYDTVNFVQGSYASN